MLHYKNFDKVRNDPEIISLYQKIHRFEDENNGWAYHDLNHVINVSNMMETIFKQLGYSEAFIDEAKVAGILHDTGCLQGKQGHAMRSYDFAKDYIKKKNLDLKYEKEILEAIQIHSNGFETKNIIALVLIFCDKLDVTKERIAPAGLKDIGIRQFQYINDIQINIVNKNIMIDFICSQKLDFKEIEAYYFTKKIFLAIRSFSSSTLFNPLVLINGTRWEAYYI